MNKNLFDRNQADSTLDDVKVLWTGQTVHLTLGGRTLTVLDATANIVSKVQNWCTKNSYRCSQVQDGRIML